jgi:hypothetical protein
MAMALVFIGTVAPSAAIAADLFRIAGRFNPLARERSGGCARKIQQTYPGNAVQLAFSGGLLPQQSLTD